MFSGISNLIEVFGSLFVNAGKNSAHTVLVCDEIYYKQTYSRTGSTPPGEDIKSISIHLSVRALDVSEQRRRGGGVRGQEQFL